MTLSAPSTELLELLNWCLDHASSVTVTCIVIAITGICILLWTRPDESPVQYKVQPPAECQPGWKGEVLKHPSIKVSGSTAVQCYCPTTGQSLGLVNPSTSDGIDRLVSRAKEAQTEWSYTSYSQRRRVLKTLLKFLLDNQDDIVTAACLDSGKTRVDALFGEILVTAEKLTWTIDHGEAALKPERRPTNLIMMYKKNTVRYEPLGVVAACVSWNYPFHNLLGPIISSLFCGNAIVVKGSEATAWSSRYFVNIVRGALTACGHSPDLVASVTCWPDVADHLTSHPDISHLTFIGSRPVAHAVCASAAKALTSVVVELGGKDAALVLDSASGKRTSDGEMNRITSILMRGVFQASGQNCIGIERIIATPASYDRIISIMEPKIKSLRLGNILEEEVDVGAMISPLSFERLEALVDEAVSRGARLLAGGKRFTHSKYPHGHYFQPTLLVDVLPTMKIAQEEVFGPIALVMRADSVDDAIEKANSTQYGLGSSVFAPTSSAADRANIEACVSRIKSGMVAVNDFACYYAVQLPFGGVRGSGYGRFAGAEGLRGLCNIKSVCEDRFSSLIRTAIPGDLDYPMNRKRGADAGKGVVELGYGEPWRKASGLRKIIGI